MRRRSFLVTLSAAAVGASQTKEAVLNRPKVPGTLNLRTRRRSIKVTEGTLRWDVAQTAVIICDMWDAHTCRLSAQRVAAMAPRMNQVVSTARSLGVMIVHAPSDTMKFYDGTPWRERMQRAPMAASATTILARCGREPIEERNFPIDDSAGGCDDPIAQLFRHCGEREGGRGNRALQGRAAGLPVHRSGLAGNSGAAETRRHRGR